MKKRQLWFMGSGVCLALFGLAFEPQNWLVWNRTASAPTGLYWLSDGPFTPGRWAVVSSQSDEAQWAAERGYVGKDWPLLKQIAGTSGDEICRNGMDILINDRLVSVAVERDSLGRPLPVWTGCQRLGTDEVFLLTPHPASLDGRYFGPTHQKNLDGIAIPVMTAQD